MAIGIGPRDDGVYPGPPKYSVVMGKEDLQKIKQALSKADKVLSAMRSHTIENRPLTEEDYEAANEVRKATFLIEKYR